MSNVVAFRQRATRAQTRSTPSPAFDEAWAAFPKEGRLRSSRKEALYAWSIATRDVSEADLVAAVRRYVAEDKDHKRECGAPGFHRWLARSRYEHWIGQPEAAITSARRFPIETVRAAVVAETSEAFAVSYLDPCEVDGGVLVVRTGVAADKLKEKAALLKSLGFTGMRRRAP